jgi:hypothetical protein
MASIVVVRATTCTGNGSVVFQRVAGRASSVR